MTLAPHPSPLKGELEGVTGEVRWGLLPPPPLKGELEGVTGEVRWGLPPSLKGVVFFNSSFVYFEYFNYLCTFFNLQHYEL